MAWRKKEKPRVIEEVPEPPKQETQQPILGKAQAQIVETTMLEGGLLRTVVISSAPLGHVGERIDLE